MRSRQNKLLVMLLFSCTLCAAQPVARLTGPSQARPGNGTGFFLTIQGNGITGPVRFIQNLPKGWEVQESAEIFPLVSQEEGLMRAVWLSFPQRDTVVYTYLLKIPKDAAGSVILAGKLEYFDDGKVKYVSVAPFDLKLRRYFSRF